MQPNLRHPQRGAVLPLVAICLAVLMGFAGMAVDVGFLEYQQQSQQAATDAAALGGAEASYADGCQSGSSAETAATTDASLNGYTANSTTLVTPNSPPTSGPYASNACAVQVTIWQQKQTFFSRIFGFNSMPESTTAVGVASQNNAGCIWLLTTQQQSNMSNIGFTAPGCNVYINDSANMSNSSINAAYIGYANGTNNISGTTFGNATPSPMGVVADPCPQMPGCAYLTNNPPPSSSTCADGSFGPNGNIGKADGTMSCYGKLSVTGTGNTICGLVEVTGSQFHIQNSTITTCSAGATIAMGAGVSDINVSGSTSLTLTAPSSGNTRGVAIWRTASQASAVNFSGCSCAVTGLMYFPTAQIDYSTASGAYSVMVFGQANFSTSHTFNLGSPPPNGTVGLKATLAE